MRFEALRERLLEGGIAPRRVRRYLGELNDHLAELTEREIAAGHDPEDAALRARALLGTDSELAESWLADPRLKSLTARAPWAVIPVLLVLLLILGFLVCIVAWVAVAYANGIVGSHHHAVPAWFAEFSHLLAQSANFVVPPLAALTLVVLVWRQRLNAYWALLASLVLVITGLKMSVDIEAHSLGVGLGYFARTPPMAYHDLPFSPWVFALQAAMILAPALWLTVRRYWQTKPG